MTGDWVANQGVVDARQISQRKGNAKNQRRRLSRFWRQKGFHPTRLRIFFAGVRE
jgi:hypothetical protein